MIHGLLCFILLPLFVAAVQHGNHVVNALRISVIESARYAKFAIKFRPMIFAGLLQRFLERGNVNVLFRGGRGKDKIC